jgi:hypothetical protein
VLLGREGLVAEEEHAVLREGAAQVLQRGLVESAREVDAAHERAEGVADGLDLHGLPRPVPVVRAATA